MQRISLRHPHGSTPIVIGSGALAAAGAELSQWCDGRTLFVVSTPRVLALHGARLRAALAGARRIEVLPVVEGEAAKSLQTAEELWRAMLRAGGKRDSRVLAFGGGSVGDLAGFVAGCFLRGVGFAQAPTTLLAQADAAIGGKTAVDVPEAKNSVGLFHHPDLVVADTDALATLPVEELRSGLVETIKVAILLDLDLLRRIESNLDALLAGEPEALTPVVAAAAAAKVRVVEADPEESGERRLLNFGHTLGHAVETALGYEGLRHGEAVGYGMLFALRLAARRGLPAADRQRVAALLRRLGLPALPRLDAAELVRLMARDKKALEGGLAWVLPAALGSGRVVLDVAPDELAAELRGFLADPLAG